MRIDSEIMMNQYIKVLRTGTVNQFAVRRHCSELCHYDLKQGSNSVLDYFTKLRGVWEELNSHRQCLVVRAFINASMRAVCEFCLEDQVIQFLISLNDSLSVVKTQVLLMEHLPSINKVYSIVIQEESNSVALFHHLLPVLLQMNPILWSILLMT
jgi:hypothetical protein